MTKTAKVWMAVIAALLAVAIALLAMLVIMISTQAAEADRDRERAKCAASYGPEEYAYWWCIERID